MILKIYRAAESFLYLPTYIAEDLKIFYTLLKDYGISSVEFPKLRAGYDGDLGAITSMLEENYNKEDSISIAIADPTAFLSEDKNIKREYIEDCCVFGAIIDKLPFWSVNHKETSINSYKDFKKEFVQIIHFKEKWTTGYYLGKKIRKESPGIKYIDVDFGQELAKLEEENSIISKNKKGINGPTCAISTDIVQIAKRKSDKTNPLIINYDFSNQGNFLTTGLITSKSICSKNEIILTKILEGIKKSILILYSSEEMANRICKDIALKQNITDLTDIDYSSIVTLINKGKFYPANLFITKELWASAIKAISFTERWDNDKENKVIESSYENNVNNSFVIAANNSIIDQLGINKFSLNDEISALFKRIESLQQKLNEINIEITKHRFVISILKIITFIPRQYSKLKRASRYALLFFMIISFMAAISCFVIRKDTTISNQTTLDLLDIGQFVFAIIGTILAALPSFLRNKR